MNFQVLLAHVKEYEERYGPDKGHGWRWRHPIQKLAKYQRHVMVEILRRGQQWPDNDKKNKDDHDDDELTEQQQEDETNEFDNLPRKESTPLTISKEAVATFPQEKR